MFSIKYAVVKAFDSGTHSATVQITGSLASYLSGVKTAQNIAAAEMVAGRNCLVVFLDPSNPEDAVVVAVYE